VMAFVMLSFFRGENVEFNLPFVGDGDGGRGVWKEMW
jgi:hypothetical protein